MKQAATTRIRILTRATRVLGLAAWACLAAALPQLAAAQTVLSEDFTGTTLTNSWTAINGACLTAGASGTWYGPSGTVTTATNGYIPGCVGLGYYTANGDAYQVGGQNGYLGNTGAPSSNAGQTPDNPSSSSLACPDTPANCGALRLTNGNPNFHESGAIVTNTSYATSSGLQVTFKTIAYRGNSGGDGGDGADGISFFILDANQYTAGSGALGSWGGSLAYSCSNQNSPYTGQVGAYLGLGMDEYGNFLNGGSTVSGNTVSSANDNTATGVAAVGWGTGNYQWNRIGMRGPGNVAWSWLHANYPGWYPSSLTTSQQNSAVQATCETGTLWNYATPSSPVNTGVTSSTASASGNTASPAPVLLDYVPIPNGSTPISGVTIATEKATVRNSSLTAATGSPVGATPIYYILNITPSGLLSLSYSYGGGTATSVLQNQSILSSAGGLPTYVYFGFAGSTGGSNNIHEILCFQAAPSDTSESSTTVNLPQDKLVSAGEVYLPSYHTTNWWGQLKAQSLELTSAYVLTVSSTINWDAACVLTGTIASSTECAGISGSLSETAGSRIILTSIPTSSGATGVGFEWSTSTAPSGVTPISSTEQGYLNAGDSAGQNRLAFLRGTRTDECAASGCASPAIFRDRTAVLGDIVHSSPDWVGPPAELGYETSFSDHLNSSAVAAENASGAQTYSTFYSTYYGREGVVYIGSNDGMVHGFSTGISGSSSVPDNGNEVLAYMPNTLIQTIHSTVTSSDYSSPNYSHVFGVDASPDADDLFYNNAWHTWLVGGLGAGGSAIYALDVTDPTGAVTTTKAFSEANAGSLVIGEWTPSNLACSSTASSTSTSTCGMQLNNTNGTPVIWRFHATNTSSQNEWGMVFGNGLPNIITGSMGTGITGTIGNNIVGEIGTDITGNITGNTTVVQTAGSTTLALNASITGTDIQRGTTVSAVSSPCTVTSCTYTLSKNANLPRGSSWPQAWTMTSTSTNLYVSSGTLPTSSSSFPMALTDSTGSLAAGTTITGYVGTAGAYSVYTVNTAQMVASEPMKTPGTTLSVSAGGGLAVGDTISYSYNSGTQTNTITAMASGTTGGPGTYTVGTSTAVGSESMSVTSSSGGTVWWLDVTAGAQISTTDKITGVCVASNTTISSYNSGVGGPGYYVLNQNPISSASSCSTDVTNSAIASETMYDLNTNSNGDAGIYIALVNPASGATPTITFYFLDTGWGGAHDPQGLNAPNGIAYVTPVDLDGDNTVDYVYAGDAFGNVWRFDLTSSSPANWHVSTFASSSNSSSATPSPLFSASWAASGSSAMQDQPITTRPIVVTTPGPSGATAVMVLFGTGEEFPFTPVSSSTYASGVQTLYGIWDWNMSNWNTLSGQTLANLTVGSSFAGGTIVPTSSTTALAGCSSTAAASSTANLQLQCAWVSGSFTTTTTSSTGTTTTTTTNEESVTTNPVCWKGGSSITGCTSYNQFGWMLPLPNTDEQIVYNPNEWQGELQVNTTIPVSTASVYSCNVNLPSGYTMMLSPATGGALTTSAWLSSSGSPLTTSGGAVVTGEQLGATGTGTVVTTTGGVSFYLSDTSSGTAAGAGGTAPAIQGQSTANGHPVTWTQLR